MKPTEPPRKPALLVRRLGTIAHAVATASLAHLLPQRKTTTALPLSKWPRWALALHSHRHPADRGLGDTLVHLIGDTRSERFKKWYARKFGKSCGCTNRQRWLNETFPYAA